MVHTCLLLTQKKGWEPCRLRRLLAEDTNGSVGCLHCFLDLTSVEIWDFLTIETSYYVLGCDSTYFHKRLTHVSEELADKFVAYRLYREAWGLGHCFMDENQGYERGQTLSTRCVSHNKSSLPNPSTFCSPVFPASCLLRCVCGISRGTHC
jgi:hypothetical protein